VYIVKTRNLALLGGSLLLAAFVPHNRTAPEKWALVVGISDYTNFGPEIGGDLPGASWDARRMRDVMVERRGYLPDHVRMILDTAATKARLMREITQWLPAAVKDGDEVTIFFAGHGSQEWDTNGDEDDGLDETICPADVSKGDTRADISDDEIEQWLSRIPTHNMSVILDNCHAGSGTRAVTPFARPRSLNRLVARDVPKPANAVPAKTVVPSDAATAAINAAGWDEFAAAQADEVAVDAEWPGQNGAPSTYGGAFTTNFVKNLWNVSRRTSYADVFAMTVEDMKRERFAQRPIFTANRNPGTAAASSAADSLEDSYVPVRAVAGNTVTLAGGASAGITTGSVYKAGSATLRVSSVKGDAASATIVSGSAPRVGMPARLSSYVYPQALLKVSVASLDAATRTAIDAATRGTSALTLVTDPKEFAHLIIRPSTDGYVVIGMDGATRHEVAGGRAKAAAELGRILHDEAAANMLASLDNPGQARPLDFSLSGGRTEFHPDDEIVFNVTAPTAGYLTIVDLGTDGTVTVLYPQKDQDNAVKAGQAVRLPPTGSYYAQTPLGRGIVRAFVTKRPMNIKWSGDGATDAATVATALRTAAGAASPSAGIPVDTWSTAALVYTIAAKK
jgi:hypothetical protein